MTPKEKAAQIIDIWRNGPVVDEDTCVIIHSATSHSPKNIKIRGMNDEFTKAVVAEIRKADIFGPTK